MATAPAGFLPTAVKAGEVEAGPDGPALPTGPAQMEWGLRPRDRPTAPVGRTAPMTPVARRQTAGKAVPAVGPCIGNRAAGNKAAQAAPDRLCRDNKVHPVGRKAAALVVPGPILNSRLTRPTPLPVHRTRARRRVRTLI